MPLLQLFDDTIAYIYLIIQIFALQIIELDIEQRAAPYPSQGSQGLTYEAIALSKCLRQIRVKGTNHIIANPLAFIGHHFQTDTLQHMTGKLAASSKSLHHLIQDGALTNAIDATQDIYMRIQFPHNVLLTTPQRINLNLLDIICVLLHSLQIFNYVANIQLFSDTGSISAQIFLKEMLNILFNAKNLKPHPL